MLGRSCVFFLNVSVNLTGVRCLGVFLSDLVFIDEGNQTTLEGPHGMKLVNWEKYVDRHTHMRTELN